MNECLVNCFGKLCKVICLIFAGTIVLSNGFQNRAFGDLISITAHGNIVDIYAEDSDDTDISSDFEAFLPFNVGSFFTATMIYDLSIPDDNESDPSLGIYDQSTPGGYFTWDIDGTVFSERIYLDVRVFDRTIYPHDWLILQGTLQLPSGWGVLNTSSLRLRLDLLDTDGSAWSSDALPTALSLDDFETKKITIFPTFSDHYFYIRKGFGSENFFYGEDYLIEGEITSLSISRIVTVPCDDLGGDTDEDHICDDGDGSGEAGDNTCTHGATEGCDDNCIDIPNLDQANGDGDMLGDVCDACPYEDATGFDADGDGCIDSLGGLSDVIDTLLDSEAIDETMATSLKQKLANAEKSATKENICAAVNQLEAFQNQVEAQTGEDKKISSEEGAMIIEYADNVIADLLSQLPQGESC
jgi:hypothetical protein